MLADWATAARRSDLNGDGIVGMADRALLVGEWTSATVPGACLPRQVVIDAGENHTCALDTAGAAWCWGSDSSGQIGDGDEPGDDPAEYTPEPVAGGRTFVAVTAGAAHSCGIDVAGKAWCWGRDASGEIGNGNDGQAPKHSPVPVAGDRTFTAIAAGSYHTCALDTQGRAWCWGRDDAGQVGDGDDPVSPDPDEYAPTLVAGDHTFTAITGGRYHTCATDTSGRAWCWGRDSDGQVGDGPADQSDKPAPVAVAVGSAYTAVAAGGAHTCAVESSGAGHCWGSDEFGQLGEGGSTAPPNPDRTDPVAVVGALQLGSVVGGEWTSCALDNGSSAWCWGYDFLGQVGDGPADQGGKTVPVPVLGGRTYGAISAGTTHTCAIESVGSAWCWGADTFGQGGDGPSDQGNKYAPALVAGPTIWLRP